MSGYVYVLSHSRMPDLVKIGFTTASAQIRARELATPTGVPGPFTLEAFFPTGSPRTDEQVIHATLAECRISGTEFFEVGPQAAIKVCIKACSYESGYLGQWSKPEPKPRAMRHLPEMALRGVVKGPMTRSSTRGFRHG